jgi:hypothetical protein
MRYAPRALLAGGVGFAVSLLAACGGGAGLLSGNQSLSLNSQLDSVSSAVNSGNCGTASQAVAAFAQTVTNLPVTVNPTLRTNLLQGASTVGALAQRDCRTSSTSTSTSTTTTKPETTTTTTTTPSTSTHTSTSTSTTTTTTPSTSTTTPATSTTTPGTTSTTGGTGGAGLGGGGGNGGGGNNGSGGNGT